MLKETVGVGGEPDEMMAARESYSLFILLLDDWAISVAHIENA